MTLYAGTPQMLIHVSDVPVVMQAVRRVLQRIKMRDTGRAYALAEASTYAITHMQVGHSNTSFTCAQAAQQMSAATWDSTDRPPSLPQELLLEALHNVAFCAQGLLREQGNACL